MNIESILAGKGRDVRTITPGETIAEAVRRMRQERIGALVVLEGSPQAIAGIVSDRGILWAIADHGVKILDDEVRSIMSSKVVTCVPEDHVSAIMGVMTQRRIRHIPVVDQEGRLFGIISIGDVVKHRLDEIQLEADELREYISGSR